MRLVIRQQRVGMVVRQQGGRGGKERVEEKEVGNDERREVRQEWRERRRTRKRGEN